MSLLALIKSASSRATTVPAVDSANAHANVSAKSDNKIMPWLAGRKTGINKQLKLNVLKKLAEATYSDLGTNNSVSGSPMSMKFPKLEGMTQDEGRQKALSFVHGAMQMPRGSSIALNGPSGMNMSVSSPRRSIGETFMKQYALYNKNKAIEAQKQAPIPNTNGNQLARLRGEGAPEAGWLGWGAEAILPSYGRSFVDKDYYLRSAKNLDKLTTWQKARLGAESGARGTLDFITKGIYSGLLTRPFGDPLNLLTYDIPDEVKPDTGTVIRYLASDPTEPVPTGEAAIPKGSTYWKMTPEQRAKFHADLQRRQEEGARIRAQNEQLYVNQNAGAR